VKPEPVNRDGGPVPLMPRRMNVIDAERIEDGGRIS
jgi:hypothetical protein